MATVLKRSALSVALAVALGSASPLALAQSSNEAELEARREQLTPANLTKVAAGKLADVAADAPGRVTNKVKDRMAQRSGNGSTARQPWQQRDWTGGGQP